MSVYQEIKSVVGAIDALATKDTDRVLEHSPVTASKYSGSISKSASKSIYYFPILASKNVTPQAMSMVSTNLEGSYMSFVSACFALTPAMEIKGDIVNVEKYLELFHQNIGLQNKDELMFSLKEDTQEYQMFPNDILNEANGSNISSIINQNINKRNPLNATGLGTGNLKGEEGKGLNGLPKWKINNNHIIKETERFNSFRPSVIEVDITFIIGGQPVKVTVPVGIKCVLHPVNPDDLLDHVMESISGKGLLHNFIRYTTGELHSLSDIIFGIKSIKNRVAKNNDVTKWISALEKRKNSTKIRNIIPFLAKKPYLPNTSIVLSMEDIAEIERVIGYNLIKEPKRTVKFMSDNFLLSFVVIDEVTQTIYVMYDGHTSFAEIPFSTIKRENDKTNDIVEALIKGIGMGQKI